MGAQQHHNIFFLDARLPFPGFDGQPRFNHANFGVEDIDEIMVGANHMERCGWPSRYLAWAVTRIDSALFFYLPCPTGGEAEYGGGRGTISTTAGFRAIGSTRYSAT